MKNKKVLIIGGGGREHAIAEKLEKEAELYFSASNAGMSQIGEQADIVIDSEEDFSSVLDFVKDKAIDMVVVGPEKYLEMGIVDYLEDAGIQCFGTKKHASLLESSKLFAKNFMLKHGIPTAGHKECHSAAEVIQEAPAFGLPVVLKADGLAAGKGVIICTEKEEVAPAAEKLFGISDKVVVEQFIKGTEASIMCFVDRDTVLPMLPARDHKRLLDNDEGPNTGGMGVVSGDILPENIMPQFEEKVAKPFMKGIKEDNIDFRGVLFVGIMYDENGELYVLEFNTRFGDPETEAVLPLMENSLYDVMSATSDNRLKDVNLTFKTAYSAVVILAAAEYPYQKTKPVEIVYASGEAKAIAKAHVLHCGTRIDGGKLLATGGRVLAVRDTGATLQEAIDNAYHQIKNVSFEGMQYRKDIGVLR